MVEDFHKIKSPGGFLGLVGAVAEKLVGGGHAGQPAIHELRPRVKLRGDGAVKDVQGLIQANRAVHAFGQKIECVIGDGAVDMHAAGILASVQHLELAEF